MDLTLTLTNGRSTRATLIHVYEREEMPASSDAPTFRNMAAAVFSQTVAATRVAVVTVNRIPIFLIDTPQGWFDVTAQPVKVTRREGESI